MTSGTSGGSSPATATGLAIAVLSLAVGGGILVFVDPRVAIAVLAVATAFGVWSTIVSSRAGLVPVGVRILSPVSVAATAGLMGWLVTGLVLGTVGSRTGPPPTSVTNPLDPAQRSAVLDYARSLTYADTVCDSRTQHDAEYGYHGQCDRNLVDTLGTIAIVSPEINIHRSRTGDLLRGRIQLRIEVLVKLKEFDPLQVYDSLGVPPGVSYIWVDNFNPTREGGSARAVVVPADSKLPAREKPVQVHHGRRWNLAVARWTPGQCWDCRGSDWCSAR